MPAKRDSQASQGPAMHVGTSDAIGRWGCAVEKIDDILEEAKARAPDGLIEREAWKEIKKRAEWRDCQDRQREAHKKWRALKVRAYQAKVEHVARKTEVLEEKFSRLALLLSFVTYGSGRVPDLRWLISAVREFELQLEAVHSSKGPPSPVVASAEEAIQHIGRPWASYKELARVTGRSASAIRSAVKRALDKRKLKEDAIQPLRNRQPGTAKVELDVRAVWPHLTKSARTFAEKSKKK